MLWRGTRFGLALFVVAALSACAPKPKERVAITYQTIEDTKEQQALVREVIAAFEKEFPHIHVEPTFAPFETLHAQIASNRAPDVFYYTVDNLGVLAANETAVDLTPVTYNDKKLTESFYPEVYGACKVDSRLHMLPVHFSVDLTYFNIDLLHKAVAESRTYVNFQELDWESVPKFAGAFVKREGQKVNQYATVLPRPLLLMQAWGTQPFAWNEVSINNPQLRKALAYYVELATLGGLVPLPHTPDVGGADPGKLFTEQKIVFFVGGIEYLAQFEGIKEFKWDIAPAPKGPKRLQPGMPAPGSMEPPQPVEVWPRAGRLSIGGNCIYGNSAHFAEAWEFVRFYSGQKAQKILSRERYAIPAVKLVAEAAEFLRKPPEHIDAWVSSRSHSQIENIHYHPFWLEFRDKVLPEVAEQLALGKMTVEEAIAFLEGRGIEMMERAKAEKKKW